jgi:hypothetical protein
MKKDPKNKRLLLLMEPRAAGSSDLCHWLKSKGFITWRANDFSHAIEELSDFTVKNRPDVVMLEVSPLPECLKTLRASFCGPDCENDVAVVAISNKTFAGQQERFFAHDLDQLETLITREAGALPC